ncbi:hypothetical protein FM111_06085 [Brevundimonas diminuta 3F5N]|uniref:Uncharacterized protein n=1 Tax=Brevundimonas diminuta 3F5N TaxID=1255603 RepID=A0A1R4FPI5_BREDI|nr:hypothetical protein FM111_06085 [Brevundimonas diminuta 3F5N]
MRPDDDDFVQLSDAFSDSLWTGGTHVRRPSERHSPSIAGDHFEACGLGEACKDVGVI